MSDTVTLPEIQTDEEQRLKRQPPYNVILLNDDDHTFEYVIRMLKQLFGHPEPKGFKMALEVHETGRVVVCTTCPPASTRTGKTIGARCMTFTLTGHEWGDEVPSLSQRRTLGDAWTSCGRRPGPD